MKVLHINTSQTGGAAWCAIRISKALTAEGIDSKMLFAEGNSLPDGVEGAIALPDKNFWHSVPILRGVTYRILPHIPFYLNKMKLQRRLDITNNNHLYLHQPFSNFKNIANHPLIDWADIIHLHWVADFVDYPSFFKKVKKPIVWTLHDKYPAVGLQHYCSSFYPVPDNLKDLDLLCIKIKRDSLLEVKNLNVVAISEMMVDICGSSEVLKGFPITLIHNGIDPVNFEMYDRQQSRKELGLISNATIFLFSGYNIHDPNKGLNRVIEALEKCDVPNKLLVCIGMSNLPIPDTSFPIILTGLITSQVKISKYYSAADVFVQSSFEETFSQTPLEAMACGTPVVALPFSGAHDLINQDNGVVCEDFSTDALSKGIMQTINRIYNREKIREDVVNRFSYDKIAQQYIELYKTVLKK